MRASALIFAAALAPTLAAAAEQIPREMQGTWAKDGKCAVAAERLVITATTATFGAGEPQNVGYAPHDGPGGRSALKWMTQGVVSNIEYVPSTDLLKLNRMGWGYPPTETDLYSRCAPG
jgi:hypothetical protein